MIAPSKKEVRYFLFSQYLADGIRITLEIALPVFIYASLGKIEIGLTMATGALCTSICDMPGPIDSKKNGMLYCIGFIFLMSLLTGFVNQHVLLLGLLIAAAAFFFTLISVYGMRAGTVGTAALLIMILRMSDILTPAQVFVDSILVACGGIWYLLVAMLFYKLSPYRPLQRALGDCIHETAKFLRIKSELYDSHTSFDAEYRKLVTQQIVVNEKQDAARELLFKNKDILKEPSRTGRLLVLAFADSVDLYEQITATWYDYKMLRQRYGSTGLLDEVSVIIKKMADELDSIGLAIHSNGSYKKNYELIPALDALKVKIDGIENNNNSNLVLKKILVNLRKLGAYIDELANYFSLRISPKGRIRSRSDYSRFVTHTEIDFVALKNNLNMDSTVFRHALRMTIACVAGFVVAKMISYGHYSYWILLTIIILLKPAFSLTKERNIQRFAGTVVGGIIGVLILQFVHDRDVLFGIIIFFMIGTYTFQRLNYIIMVIFITPYILILLNLLGPGLLKIAEERLLDTGIACAISFLASYLLFPRWESQQLDSLIKKVLKANINYLDKLRQLLSGKEISSLDYKLARKEVYISTANMTAAFNRMLSEPKHTQRNSKLIYEFVVLNHVLSSNIASISADMLQDEHKTLPKAISQKARRSVQILQQSLLQIDKEYILDLKEGSLLQTTGNEAPVDKHLNEQLDFIHKVAQDIQKVTKIISL